jgi:two-component system heavy metal sensor histidine kinase CusS
MSWKTVRDRLARRPARRWSLATRLTIWYAGSAFLLMAVAGTILYRVVVDTLDAEDRDDVAVQVADLQRILKVHPLNFEALRQEIEEESTSPSFSPVYERLLDRDGHQMLETFGMSAFLPVHVFPSQPVTDVKTEPMVLMHAPDGRVFRGLTTVVGDGYTLQVALDQAGDVRLLRVYRRRLTMMWGVGWVICLLVGYAIARRGLRPVHQIADAAQRIQSTTLNARVVTAGLPAELSTLAATFNEMLDRLERAFSRLTQFSADIAHELRTPINNLRGVAEVALDKPHSEEEYREVLTSCLEDCLRLSRLIDRLLFLARAENEKTQVHRERLDVSRELSALCEFYEASASEAGVALTATAPAGLNASLDRTLFQRAIGNLIENSLAYTARGGAITIAVTQDNDALNVAVADTGCGIPPEHLPGMFERFHRVDASRSKQTGGSGLGLAIVKSIVSLHGGTVRIASQVGIGTSVTLRFPAATDL